MKCSMEQMAMADPATTIIPYLHMGSVHATDDKSSYDMLVSAASEWDPYKLGSRSVKVTRLHIPLEDLPWDFEQNINELFDLIEVTKIVSEYVAAGHEVLVFCSMGMNRSGVVVAMTMMHLGYSPSQAVRLVRRRHPCALSNKTFVEALKFARRRRLA